MSSLLPCAWAIDEPTGLRTRAGDRSLVVHWDHSLDTNLLGYRLYTATKASGPFAQVTPVQLFVSPSYALVNATNGLTYYYQAVRTQSVRGRRAGGAQSASGPDAVVRGRRAGDSTTQDKLLSTSA